MQQLDLPHLPTRTSAPRDTRVIMALYILSSTHIRNFTHPFGVNAYNVGITLERNLADKVADIGNRAYGSIVAPAANRGQAVATNPCSSLWNLEHLPDPNNDPKAARMLAELPGGACSNGIILFRLPHYVRIGDVERRFHRLLSRQNLNAFLETKTARRRLIKARLPADARLFTDYHEMQGTRRSLATELFVIDPWRDLSTLLQALASAVAANDR